MTQFFGEEGFSITYPLTSPAINFQKSDEVRVEPKSKSELFTVYDVEKKLYQKKFGNRWSWKVIYPNPIQADLTTLDALNYQLVNFKPHAENDDYYECYMWYYYDDSTPYKHKVYIFLTRKSLELTLADDPQSLAIVYPNGAESITIGDDVNITWSSNRIQTSELVKIDLYKGGVFDSVISASTENDYLFVWDSTGTAAGIDYQIYIEFLSNSTISDLSDANFEMT